MRDFESLKLELELIEFDKGKNGTLYFPKDTNNRILVRHFDKDISVEFIPIYAKIIEELQRFIDNNSVLSKFIQVVQLDEVGKDFIIRERFVYIASIHNYFRDDEDYVEPPPAFYIVKEALEKLESCALSPKEVVLVNILIKSFIRSTFKTVPMEEKFINYEPKMDVNDLKEWQATTK